VAATLKDIAKEVGVHPSTVSRVLSGKYDHFNVSKETRDSILKVAKEWNYVPDDTARSLRLQKTQTIGLIIPDILNPFHAGLARSIGFACESNDYHYIICNTDEDQDKEIKFIELLRRRKTDGMIIIPVQNRKDHLEALKQENYPLVLVSRHFEDLEVNSVITDSFADAFQSVDYLAKLGHRRIAFISGRRITIPIQERERGYKEALMAHNIVIDHDLIVGDGFTTEDGYAATKKVLGLPEKPTALLVSANIIIVGVLEAVFEAGLLIPDDISIVAFTEMRATPYLSLPLTGISQPVIQMGKKAVSLLLKQIEATDKPRVEKIVLASKFTIGKSTQKALGS
jgi:LacI family transcriptional regulator